MADLDNPVQMAGLDPAGALESIKLLPDQLEAAWQAMADLELPEKFTGCRQIIFSGMGGSGLGARMIESLYGNKLKVPLIRVHDYHLPQFADEKTVVICTSYSGNTEETLSTAKEAEERGIPWMAISTGGKLLEYAQEKKAPFYRIEPKFNPSNSPRMSTGYLLGSQLGVIHKLGLLPGETIEIGKVTSWLREHLKGLLPDTPVEHNYAKQLAWKMVNKQPVLVAAAPLTGAAHVIKNQLNESAKTFADLFELPELNHHLLDGLAHPPTNQQSILFTFIDSPLYPERIRERLNLTEEVAVKQQAEVLRIHLSAPEPLTQAFELIQLGSMAVYYLSMLYHTDPAPNPWVDYFKEKLS